jgi:serine protease AprX
MAHAVKSKKPKGRRERHSAAWGKRLSLMLLLATGMAFGEHSTNSNAGRTGRIASELSGLLAKARQGSTQSQTVKVIVQYRQVPRASHYAAMRGRGARLQSKLHMIKSAAFTIPVSALTALEADPEIVSVSIDHPMNVMDDLTNDATGVSAAGIIGGNGSLSGGEYAGVAPGVNLIDLRALDANGAGTDSTVIAAIQQAIALKDIYNIRVINLSLGRGIPVSYTQDPLCQAVEAAWNSGIVVVVAAGNYGRLSLNGSNGYGTVTAPGNDPLVLTVGATKSNGSPYATAETIASFSSKGPTTYDHVMKPDLLAPGNAIVSLAAPGASLEASYSNALVTGTDGKNDYFRLSGTSMATPAVAGAAALLLQQQNALTPDQVKARLMKTAYKMGYFSTSAWVPHLYQSFLTFYDLFSVGAGMLNVQSAIANNDQAPATVGSALSPTVVFNPLTHAVSLVQGNSTVASTSVVWGSSVVWGTSVVWGSSIVNGTSVVWGASLPWNDNTLSAFSVVWGASTGMTPSSVVWGASVSTANSAFTDAGDDEQ